MKNILIVLTITFTAISLSGCNTVNGFGKDVGKLGDKIADKSEKHTNK